MSKKRVGAFGQAVTAFKDASPWLTAADQPALVMLEVIAAELDSGDRTPALIGQFGLTYRSLLKRAPQSGDSGDPLEGALREAGAA